MLYRDWLLHNEQFLSDDMKDAEPENKEEKYSAINKENVIDDSNEEDIELMYVDYKNKGFYKNTQVIFFEYFGTREYGIETWSYLYEKVYQCLLDDYPHIINGQMSKAIGYSADAIVNKVGQLLKMCNIDAENLVIAYKYKDDEAVAVLQEHNTNINVSKENDIEQLEEEDNKHKFVMWLNKKGFKNSDVMLMKFDMSRMSKMAIAKGITEKDLFDVKSMDALKMIGYRLQRTSDFLRLDIRLKPYLEYVCEPDEYYFAEDYMTKDKNVKIDHSSEIEEFLLSMGKPLSYDEIYAGLSHISKEIIYNEIKSNPNIVLNERGHYYHYGIFEFTSEDADRISGFISEDIEEDGYCIWSRVFVKIQKNMPLFIENNAYLSSIGIRNAVSKKLSGRFNFDGEVICNLGQFLSMAAVYRLYGEHKAPFSDDDIYKFSKEVSGGVIYFDSLSETVVRTSRKQFVNKNDVKFDVEEIDNALATYLSTGYMLIKDIDSFLVFPNVGYEWNAFLLESYLMYYSSKYTLLNNGRSLNNVAGALVRKGSGYDDFVEVCADVLANSDCVLTKQKALDYLADQNLLTRRSYSRIDSAITKAKQIRNKEG